MNIAEAGALLAAFLTSVVFLLSVASVSGKRAEVSAAPSDAPAERAQPLIGEPPGWQR